MASGAKSAFVGWCGVSKLRNAAKAINTADRAATHTVAKARDHPAVKTVGLLSEAADQPPLIALSVGTLLLGVVLRRPVLLRSGARMLAAELIATGMKHAIKRTVDRTRPEQAMTTGKRKFAWGDSEDHEETSFPSGHTAGAVAVARAVAHEVPGSALTAYTVAGAVGAVQMPRGKHYVLDTVAGAAIGYVAEVAAGRVLRLAEATFRRLKEGGRRRPVDHRR